MDFDQPLIIHIGYFRGASEAVLGNCLHVSTQKCAIGRVGAAVMEMRIAEDFVGMRISITAAPTRPMAHFCVDT